MYKVMDLVIPYRLVKHQIPSMLSFLFKILYTEHTLFLHKSEKKEEGGKKKKTDYLANFPFTINFCHSKLAIFGYFCLLMISKLLCH